MDQKKLHTFSYIFDKKDGELKLFRMSTNEFSPKGPFDCEPREKTAIVCRDGKKRIRMEISGTETTEMKLTVKALTDEFGKSVDSESVVLYRMAMLGAKFSAEVKNGLFAKKKALERAYDLCTQHLNKFPPSTLSHPVLGGKQLTCSKSYSNCDTFQLGLMQGHLIPRTDSYICSSVIVLK